MTKKTSKELRKWRKHWMSLGYKLIHLELADDAEAKRSFWKEHIKNMYQLKYVSVRPKRGKLWGSVHCIKVVSLGSYHPSPWHFLWFKNAELE